MNRISNRQGRALLILAAALLLRASIPAGYMPAGGESGLWYTFCPAGVPAEFMQILAGDQLHESGGHHGEHAEHQDDPHDGHSPDDQCPIGQLLQPAASIDSAWHPDTVPTAPVFEALPVRLFAGTTRTYYLSRGPPA